MIPRNSILVNECYKKTGPVSGARLFVELAASAANTNYRRYFTVG